MPVSLDKTLFKLLKKDKNRKLVRHWFDVQNSIEWQYPKNITYGIEIKSLKKLQRLEVCN